VTEPASAFHRSRLDRFFDWLRSLRPAIVAVAVITWAWTGYGNLAGRIALGAVLVYGVGFVHGRHRD
jgi:hypothetical protein